MKEEKQINKNKWSISEMLIYGTPEESEKAYKQMERRGLNE